MKINALFLTVLAFLYSSSSAMAQIGISRSGQGDRGITLPANSGEGLKSLITNTITLFFSVGAIGFIIMFLWGAVDWILSGGDKEKIAGARKRITTAIIGLVLLSLTFVIMVVVGQILGIDALKSGTFELKGLLDR